MKLSLLAAIALAAILATTAKAETEFNMTLCKSQLATAAKVLQGERDLNAKGIGGPGRIAKAELSSLKIRFNCHDILATEYCQKSLTFATAYVKALEEAFNKGHIAENLVEEAKFELLKFKVQCL